MIELKGELDKSRVVDGDFSTPLSVIDEISQQKSTNRTKLFHLYLIWIQLIFMEHSTQQEHNMQSSQIHIEHSQ